MSDFQEYPDVVQEVRGAYNPGRLKLQSSSVIFKNAKTGKVDQYQSSDIERVNWLKRARGNCLKFILNTGLVHRYDGFKEAEFEKLATFMSKYYALSLEKQDMSVKGWNWGCSKFIGNSLDFEVDNKLAFEIPLNNVSHSTTTKNEVTLEFHQNDDAAVSLMEIRFHIPSTTENSEKDPVQDFYNMVVDKADIIQATGDAIATFTELQCLTPRGRYDFKIFQSFLQLHGKTFDYKIPYTTVLRLFLLPHKDGRQMFFVISLDPPIKQGQTRYPFIILLFNKDDEMTLNLTMSEEDLEKKYEGKLQPEISGPDYEVISRVFKAITNRKITVPGSFVGHSGTNAISCSYKAATGFLYPLERGFVFIHKPPLHIRFDEVAFVNFGRSAGSTKSFDFDVETKSGTVYNFVGIEKDEYGKLYDFVTQKNLRVKNIGGKLGGKSSYAEDMVGSDDDDEHDAYMERMKEEGKDRFEGDEEDDSDSSDVSYNPGGSSSEVAEEYDSNPPTTDEEDSSEGGSGEDEAKKEERRKRKEEKKKAKAAKTVKEPGERKSKKSKKKSKDSNKPKRPQSAYFLWFNANREDIKKELPGASVTDISKRAGELWKEVTDRSEWDAKAEEAKKEYQKAMEEYNKTKAEKGDSDSEDDSKKSSKKKDKKKSPKKSKSSETTAGSGGQYKSKEFISSSSSDSDKPLKKKTRTERAKKKNDGAESDKSSSVGELPSEEEILPSPEKSSAGSGSESESGSD